ncbi:retrovirus-related Pol polyprotein from transposon 17.6 [Trichonephila clavipes]|nr:retrovirus-related Pol polyprotein from transposon 17.6 [Trichonephila clavipes]
MMSEILSGCEKYATPYLDGIAIFSEAWEEHLKHLQEILERLKKANLTIKPFKCKFTQLEVQYLGHVVGRVTSLTDLLKGFNKKGGIVWNDKCSELFKMLKERLYGKPLLHAPDFSKLFILQTDASDQGHGVVLAQKDKNGGKHPILFLSRSTELDKELLFLMYPEKAKSGGGGVCNELYDHRPCDLELQLSDEEDN